MLLKTETYKIQQSLSEYCRNGKEVNIAGARAERLPHYRRLVYNVIKSALESSFPIAFKYVNENDWEKMGYNFFGSHKCQTAQIWRMPEEFYEFCVEQNYSDKFNIPYLNNLLYFEWLEVDLYMMEDISYPEFIESAYWTENKIAINPEFKLIKLEYPVHNTKPDELKNQKGNYFLLLFREKESGKIQFIELSVLYAFLIENIINQEKNYSEILNNILYVFGINDLNFLHKKTNDFLIDLKEKGFILGILK
ncbi:MAG: putative DNA-binding domain-containing protein [Mariniphaga sp.]|nr:putative DNA-binding domain-containing protein [Mariniphaga sp.]